MSPKENVEVTDNNCKSTIDLVFKVFAPSLNRMIHRMYLLGSLQQMGAWNIQDAAQAFPTPDFHTWRVDIRNVPIHSSFEWSWVKARSNKTDVKWERMVKRNRTVDCFGGVIHTIYGDGEEVFVQSATYAEVGTYRKVDQGQYLALTGCSQTTGAWNIEKAVKATEYPRMSGYWRVQIAFDSNSSLQFKWAILNETNKQLHMIEKEDHFLYGRQTWMRVVAPWNVPRVFVEDTPICLEPMDHVMGRTDVLVNAKKAHTESIRQWLKTDSKTKSLALVSISNVRTPKPAQPPKNAPRKTNVEKAKEALKNFMALTVTESDSKLSGNSLGSASNRVPTVLPLENVDDHAKKRAENARLVLNKQQDNERKAFNSTIPIKGKGQTVMAKTSELEMLNQQPMVDASLMSLVHVTESEAGKEPQGSFKYVGQPSSSSSSGNQGPSGASSLTSIMPKPQPLGKSKIAKVISNPDMMLEQMEHLKAVFKEIETDPAKGKQGLPVMERDISLISSNPPPTWSMLQEDEVMRTSNPVVATTAASQASSKKEFIKAPPPLKPVKKTLLTDKKPGLAPTPLTVPKQSTTLESFKPRPTLFNTDRGKPFVLTVGSGKEPSSVGMDDTMKSPSDLQLEYDNRKMWEKKVMTSQQGQGQDSNPFLGKGKFNNNS